MNWVWAAIDFTGTIAAWELIGYLNRRFVRGTKRIEVPRRRTKRPTTVTIYRGEKD